MSRHTNELKALIASRATEATVKKFYKSYIKDLKLVEERPIKDHLAGWTEKDYTFSYKDVSYRLIEKIVPTPNGLVAYSAKYRYEIIQL